MTSGIAIVILLVIAIVEYIVLSIERNRREILEGEVDRRWRQTGCPIRLINLPPEMYRVEMRLPGNAQLVDRRYNAVGDGDYYAAIVRNLGGWVGDQETGHYLELKYHFVRSPSPIPERFEVKDDRIVDLTATPATV